MFYLIIGIPGSHLFENSVMSDDVDDVYLNITEQWDVQELLDNDPTIKIIIDGTPLNICIENNKKRDDPISVERMEYFYNNYILTVGWLYLEHSEKIINSAHL